ncbi:MAG TPA: MFS transporter, partial [Candidatus Limnocylindria bacterium]|nr:MFS transporter [Candidatus Limnocylindria bacterium]
MTKAVSLIGPDRKYERWRWQIFAITWLAYTGFYLTRKSFAVAKIEMAHPAGLGLTNNNLASIDFVYLVTYAIGQFAWGICGDRWGTRRVIVAGMLCSVLAAVAMGASSTVILLGTFFGLQGFCQSTGWAPLSKNIGNFFSQRERGTVMGLWCTNYAVGGFVASIIAGRFGQALGWRWAFFGPAAILFAIWILFLLFQRNRPEDVGLPSVESYHGEPEPVLARDASVPEEKEGSWSVVLDVLKKPMVLLLAGVYFFMKPTRYAIMNWAPKYIHE